VADKNKRSYADWLARWVDLTRRAAAAVVIAAVLATVATAGYVATHMRINTSTTDMLSPDLPFRQHSRRVSEAFPQFSDNLLVVIDGQTPDLVDDAADMLAARLRQRPEVFGEVFDAAGEPFFRRNGLLYLDVEDLGDLADRLAEAQPFLGTLWRDPSLRGLFVMLELAVDQVIKEDGQAPIEVGRVLGSIADVMTAQAEGGFRHLSWRNLMSGDGDDDYRRLILIDPALNFASLQPAAAAMAAVRGLAAEMGLQEGQGVRVRLSGSAALSHEELKSVEEGMGVAAVLSLTLVVILLLVGLGSARLASAILATLIMGLVWTAGAGLAVVGQFNLISVAFAVLFIGLSVDFGIHFGLRYREDVDAGADQADALRGAASGVGGALTLCAVAAAIGFFSFLPTDYLGLAELGQIAGIGMFIALFANLTVLPAILALMPVRPTARAAGDGRSGRVHPFIRAHCRAFAWGGLALGVAATALLPQAGFDFDPLNLKDPRTESVSTLFDIMDDSRSSPYAITVLAPSLEASRGLADRLAALPEVDGAESLLDFVPDGQDEKLDIITDMALFLAPSLDPGQTKERSDDAAERTALTSLIARLVELEDANADAATRRAATRLRSAVQTILPAGSPDTAALAELRRRLLSGLPGRLEALRQSLEAGPVTVDDLPNAVRSRQVAADGRAKVKVYPKENVLDREALRRFVAAVRRVAPTASGSPVVILEAGNAVVASFRDAALIALAAIGLLLAVLLRRLRDVLLVFAPLVLAALLTVAASVLFGLPFNFANVIVLPLLFGLGVASGIHLVTRQRDAAAGQDVMRTSTPRAVVFSALTTIGSFASIALSSHPGTASMGILLTIAITLTLASTLFVLPALMEIWPPASEETKS
jgi:uncharacterized protein